MRSGSVRDTISARKPAKKNCAPKIIPVNATKNQLKSAKFFAGMPLDIAQTLYVPMPKNSPELNMNMSKPTKPKKVHGLATKPRNETDSHQVEQTVRKSLESKLAHPIGTRVVRDHLLANLVEARRFGKHRNVTVHFALDFNGFHHVPTIALQATVEIVQMNAADLSRGPIVELRRNGFAQWVVTFLLPSTHQVQTSFQQLRSHGGELLRVVLQIGIHGEHHRAARCFKPLLQGRTFSVVPGKANASDRLRLVFLHAFDHRPRTILAPIVNENDLKSQTRQHAVNARFQLAQAFFFVQQRHNDRHIQCRLTLHGFNQANSEVGVLRVMAATIKEMTAHMSMAPAEFLARPLAV